MSAKLDFDRRDFPDGFRFGTATSSYQIEGSSFGGCGVSHWDTFAATPGNVVRHENGSVACDHYHRWEEDLDLIAEAGLDCYRFSTSWARVLPQGTGEPNEEGLDFYDRLVDGMLERGLEPHATLYHWDLPHELAAKGGWQNRDVALWFSDYAVLMARRLGDRLTSIATFNEPWCISWLSHFHGHHAPGLRDVSATAKACHNVLLAHGSAVEALRQTGSKNVGVVMNFEYSHPCNDEPANVKAARLYDGIYNRWFLGGVFRGEYPADVLEGLGPYLPHDFQDDFAVIQQPVDWLGINYYTRKLICHQPDLPWPSLGEVEGPLEKTAVDWEVYPDGLFHFLTFAHEHTGGDLPIFVTENGMAGHDRLVDGAVDDEQRISYLNCHLAQVRRAIETGVPVKGYFIWSMLDNYEWALGYDKRFGLVHVDFDTLARTPKASWHELKRVLG